jgi:tRNA pseudouridine38-40 synthase
MSKIKLTIAYDGTDFHGYQSQGTLRTVQKELEDALEALLGQRVEAFGASRTDAGVHAKGQTVHVTVEHARVPVDQLARALRGRLPRDLAVTEAVIVSDDFDARHSPLWKRYRYTVDTGRTRDVFSTRIATHMPYTLDDQAMAESAAWLLGEHDFTSFCTTYAQQKKKVRTIYAIEIQRGSDNLLHFDVVGRSFLHNMVRIMVGTLIEVGRGRLAVGALDHVLRARDRRQAGPTAPPHGLCLCHIEYPRDVSLAVIAETGCDANDVIKNEST